MPKIKSKKEEFAYQLKKQFGNLSEEEKKKEKEMEAKKKALKSLVIKK